VSPILWAKVAKGTSAGRVQSVAVRIVVDREREIKAFVPQEYWTLTATLAPLTAKPQLFDAMLTQFNSKKIELKTQDETDQVLADLRGATYTVAKVKKSERQRRPTAPFITSTIQQEAARKLGFSSKRTMSVAQQLYEGIDLGSDGGQVGLITYMRTDSTRISNDAQAEARQYILTNYGEKYAPAKPNVYKTKGSAQDAHEAIRPTATFREPDALQSKLSTDQYKLYRLIWLRFVASQMTPAIMDVVTADIAANAYTFRAAGSTVKFDGFLRVYQEGKDEVASPANQQTDETDEEKPPLPPLTEGQTLDLRKLLPKQHFTEPPPRFSEATLVKALEEQGIGRPSTYASIISTIQDRGYVELREKRFYPTDLGFVVTDYLVKNFAEIMDVHFTADMETREAYVRAAVWKNNDATSTLPSDQVAAMAEGEEFILTITANGYGKISSAYEYRTTSRGGQGITNIGTPESNPERNGPVVASFPVKHGSQLMLVTDQAKLIRLGIDFRHLVEGGFETLKGFAVSGRGSSGVRVFDVAKGEHIVGAALIGETVEAEDVGDGAGEPPVT